MRKIRAFTLVLILGGLSLSGCETVKFYQRKKLGDPIMEVRGSSRSFAEGKVFTSREGASGASGASAGGGCGCY
ncbi:MAG: DUF4266 domain-containing protein [Planctomycetota bacterium]|nr:DUF4266 domain-containing protein [Planctomycetota bacterium]